MSEFPTVGVISKREGVPIHRVVYLLRARKIKPAWRAGNTLVYSEADARLIAEELRKIASRRAANVQ